MICVFDNRNFQDGKGDKLSDEELRKKRQHQSKVKEHLKQVMDTLSDFEKDKDSAKLKHRQNFRYADPKVQSIMDNLEKMEKGDKATPGFHKIEL